MAEIVNLRRARKDKAKREREAEADANRHRFGRTRAEKDADREAADRAVRQIDGKRLEPEKKDYCFVVILSEAKDLAPATECVGRSDRSFAALKTTVFVTSPVY